MMKLVRCKSSSSRVSFVNVAEVRASPNRSLCFFRVSKLGEGHEAIKWNCGSCFKVFHL